MKHGVLARELVSDPSFEGIDYTRHTTRSVSGEVERIVIVAEGETAKELLPEVENFEALMGPQEVVS